MARAGRNIINCNILIATIGSSGDVNHFIGIGEILKNRGHRVTLITNGAFEKQAIQAGIDFEAVSPAEDYHRLMQDPRISDWRVATRIVVGEGVLRHTEPHYESIQRLYQPGRTLLVSNGISFGARIAQEKLGIPAATVIVSAAMMRSIYSPPRYTPATFRLPPTRLRQQLYRMAYQMADKRIDRVLGESTNAFRAKLDLPPAQKIMARWWFSPQCVFALWPEWFAPKQPDWPPQTRLMGFPLYDGSQNANSTEEQAALDLALHGASTKDGRATQPPILFTMGSFAVHDYSFFAKASAACQSLKRRGVFLLGSNRTVPQSLPSHMGYLDHYVPLSRLMPRVAALVHHGGIGTASMAFAAGIPQVITPLAHDHFDNSRRIVRLGVGREVRAKNMTSDTLATALDEVLNSASVQASCERVKGLMQNNQSLERTCDALEELADKTLLNSTETRARLNSGIEY